ncbi:helix-turn-helix domain-containing protein [Croceiramulus getboli]|nr:helix-turn-helix domain-containing protein [Flavobacteriaceae bacterium YJPT1-3]
MKLSFTFFIAFLLSNGALAYAQDETNLNNRLQHMSYKELLRRYDDNLDLLKIDYIIDSLLGQEISRAYIAKAKILNDSIEIARGFERFARVSPYPLNLSLADSCIHYTPKTFHNNYPTIGYLIKGDFLYQFGRIEEAIEATVKAYNLSLKRNNLNYLDIALNQLAVLQLEWGDFDAGIITMLDYLDFVRNNKGKIGYFFEFYNDDFNESLALLDLAYYSAMASDVDKAREYFQKAEESFEAQPKTIKAVLRGEYSRAKFMVEYADNNLDEAKWTLDACQEFNDTEYAIGRSLFYYGMLAYKENDLQTSIKNIISADSVYQNHHYLDVYPELLDGYKVLIDYYRNNDQPYAQMEYMDKYIEYDSIVNANYKYVRSEITEQVRIPELLAEKQDIIDRLDQDKAKLSTQRWIWMGMTVVASALCIWYFIRRRQLRKRYLELLQQDDASETVAKPKTEINCVDLDPELCAHITQELEHFEQSKGYISQEVSLIRLAKVMSTNSTYLSRYINATYNKNFSQYLKDLRIDHAVKRLRYDPILKKMTVAAIAEEVGFGSGKTFAKAFKERTGIQPSYFIKQLENDEAPQLLNEELRPQTE